jgi:hypothetical protein
VPVAELETALNGKAEGLWEALEQAVLLTRAQCMGRAAQRAGLSLVPPANLKRLDARAEPEKYLEIVGRLHPFDEFLVVGGGGGPVARVQEERWDGGVCRARAVVPLLPSMGDPSTPLARALPLKHISPARDTLELIHTSPKDGLGLEGLGSRLLPYPVLKEGVAENHPHQARLLAALEEARRVAPSLVMDSVLAQDVDAGGLVLLPAARSEGASGPRHE